MPQEMSASDPVIGWVERFNTDKGYGFVNPMLTGTHPIIGKASRVFIHVSRYRVFAGTPENPEITLDAAESDWVKRHVVPGLGYGGSRTAYSYVVMNVGPGAKGPLATAWTVIPRRQTLDDVLRFGGLRAYVGMEIAILPVTQALGGGQWGVLKSWALSGGKVELSLTSARGPGLEPVQYGDISRVIEFDCLRVVDDSSSQITLRLQRTDQPTLDVVCWRRPPRH
jgi:hypothetical protein